MINVCLSLVLYIPDCQCFLTKIMVLYFNAVSHSSIIENTLSENQGFSYIWFNAYNTISQFSRSVVSDSATPWIAAHQASLSITNSRSSLPDEHRPSVFCQIPIYAGSDGHVTTHFSSGKLVNFFPEFTERCTMDFYFKHQKQAKGFYKKILFNWSVVFLI